MDVISLGKNGTDFTGLALLLGLGFLAIKFWNFKLPEISVPSLQVPVIDFSGLFNGMKNGTYTPTPSYKIVQQTYTKKVMPTWMEDLIHEPEQSIDLHKEITKTKGQTAQYIIEKGLTPSIPKNGSQVKDLHKEMEATIQQTSTWIAKRPELYLQTRR